MNAILRCASPVAVCLLLALDGGTRSANPEVGAAPDTSWREHYRLARAAFAADDLAGARHHFTRADAIIGGHPNALYNLAIVEAQSGNAHAALGRLGEFAASGLARDAARDTLLAPLRAEPRFTELVAKLKANGAPLGAAVVVHDLGDPTLLAEDVARGKDGRFFVSSIHRRKIVVIGRDGVARDFTRGADPERWGVLGLRLDERRDLLWATTAAIRTIERYELSDSGRTALLAFDLATGAVRRRAELPRDGRPHVLGDLTLAADGTVYVTDSVGGGVYVLRPGAAALDTILPPGTFTSPQTPVLAPDQRRLIVPDYPRGLAAIEIASGRVSWLPKPRSLAAAGVDGLYAARGGLIAIQNGTHPKRVLWLDTDAALTRITGWSVLEQASERLGEPSHGVVSGRAFHFLGDTGWDRVNDAESLVTTPESTSPVILRLDLPKTR